MHFISTANNQKSAKTLSAVIGCGLAEDGGLFIPHRMPTINPADFSPDLSYPLFANKLLQQFFYEDELASYLPYFCNKAFDFTLPLKQLNSSLFVLELFHGPSSSFKDFGARFLAECLNTSGQNKKTIMVATSGDTGSAVASAFYKKSNCLAVILYPKGQISPKQEHQMTCWDENIIALAVHGSFDDCQKLVKSAFSDPDWQLHRNINSANSINIGRLLPQIVYYAYSSIQFYKQYAIEPGFIIPTGNLGNATAGYWAKAMGFPIREIVLATNANKVILDYLETGRYQPCQSISTIANAMDVGSPSNFERLKTLFNTFSTFKKHVKAFSATDYQIKKMIKETYLRNQYIACPHTATAFYAHQQLDHQPWIVIATADPCKFNEIIEPIIEEEVPIAPQLKRLLAKPTRISDVAPDLGAIKKLLKNY